MRRVFEVARKQRLLTRDHCGGTRCIFSHRLPGGAAILAGMRLSPGHYFLRLLAGLFAAAGFLAWIGVAWRAFSGIDNITAQSDEGGRLMSWALAGTVLMIVGMVLLHVAADAADRDRQE